MLRLKVLSFPNKGLCFHFAATSQVLWGHRDLVQGQEPVGYCGEQRKGPALGWEGVQQRDASSWAPGGRRQEEGLCPSLRITSAWPQPLAIFRVAGPAPT